MSRRPIRIRVRPDNVPKWDRLAEHSVPLVVVRRSDNVVFLDHSQTGSNAAGTRPPCGEDGRCGFDRELACRKQFGRSCFSAEADTNETSGQAEVG